MPPINRPCATLCALALLVALSGCGQKGPLYIPQPETPPSESTPAPEPTR